MSTAKIESRRKRGKLKVGLIGCGAIGKALAQALGRRPLSRRAQLVALHDQRPAKAISLSRRIRPHPEVLPMEGVVKKSRLILEAASAQAVAPLLKMAVRYRRDLLVISSAGLVESTRLLRRAKRAGCRISVPSGALGGIDGVKAFSKGSIRKVILTTRKPPSSFSLKNLRRPKLLFAGPARLAVRAFPQNVNVAATVLLSGVPSSKFRVRVIADPSLSRNAHELSVEGTEGLFFCRLESRPSENPKTSQSALLSAVATLQGLFETMHVGT